MIAAKKFSSTVILCMTIVACGGQTAQQTLPDPSSDQDFEDIVDISEPADDGLTDSVSDEIIATPGPLPVGGNPSFDPSFGFSDVDFKRYLAVLIGRTSDQRNCYLGVLDHGYDLRGNYNAVVESNFQHDGSGPGSFALRLRQDLSFLMVGTNDSNGRMQVQIGFDDEHIENAIEYSVRWISGGKSLVGYCSNMRVVQ